jgi:hypothetical protein
MKREAVGVDCNVGKAMPDSPIGGILLVGRRSYLHTDMISPTTDFLHLAATNSSIRSSPSSLSHLS